MKVNPEYLSFATHQSNNGGRFLLVFAGVVLIIWLCLAAWSFLRNKDIGGSVFVAVGVAMFLLIMIVPGIGSFDNQQIKGNIQDIETATGAQIISIDGSNVNGDSHGDIIIGKNDAQVNLTKNVSYIKHGKVYTNGVIVMTQGRAGLFNNEKGLQPILAKK